MSAHHKNICTHGVTVSQCRCPSGNTTVVPCPESWSMEHHNQPRVFVVGASWPRGGTVPPSAYLRWENGGTQQVPPPPTPDRLRAGAEALHDLLTMLDVDPDERPEHGGPTMAEALAGAVLLAADRRTRGSGQ